MNPFYCKSGLHHGFDFVGLLINKFDIVQLSNGNRTWLVRNPQLNQTLNSSVSDDLV